VLISFSDIIATVSAFIVSITADNVLKKRKLSKRRFIAPSATSGVIGFLHSNIPLEISELRLR
jgi:hypothetical protein